MNPEDVDEETNENWVDAADAERNNSIRLEIRLVRFDKWENLTQIEINDCLYMRVYRKSHRTSSARRKCVQCT